MYNSTLSSVVSVLTGSKLLYQTKTNRGKLKKKKKKAVMTTAGSRDLLFITSLSLVANRDSDGHPVMMQKYG